MVVEAVGVLNKDTLSCNRVAANQMRESNQWAAPSSASTRSTMPSTAAEAMLRARLASTRSTTASASCASSAREASPSSTSSRTSLPPPPPMSQGLGWSLPMRSALQLVACSDAYISYKRLNKLNGQICCAIDHQAGCKACMQFKPSEKNTCICHW